MRLQNNLFAPHAAPATGVAVASLHKINRAFIFRAPGAFYNAVFRFIHLNETSRRQNRIHSEILHADISVSEVAIGELC
jgi:hypothetical protein